MPRVTMKNLNEYLGNLAPLELVKGNGYFWFAQSASVPLDCTKDVPESIPVCHLNHLTGDKWWREMDNAAAQWNADNPS
jgi:hypothetical protein